MTASERDSGGANRRTRKLTTEQVRAIAERIAAGERHVDVATRFGVSVETVRAIKSGKRRADAIDEDLRERMQAASPTSALDSAAVRRIIAALESGRSGREIAEQFGISASMVSAIKHGRTWSTVDPGVSARLAEKPQRGKALSAAQVAQIKRQLIDGRSSRQVAAAFGVSASTVLAIARGTTWARIAPASANEADSAASAGNGENA